MFDMKRKLYEGLLERQTSAAEGNYHYESCWFAHAILENRTSSILSNVADRAGFGKDISSKLNRIKDLIETTETKVVSGRAVKDRRTGNKVKKPKWPEIHTVKRSLVLVALRWIRERNVLVHDLASGKMSLEEADKKIECLSKVALRLTREYCSAARRVKKRAKKIEANRLTTP